MIKHVGRIVFRNNTVVTKPDLIIGVCTKGQKIFRGNEVYDIYDIMGEITLKKRGKSVIDSEIGKQHFITWGKSVNDLLHMGKYIYLTAEEYKQCLSKD